MARANTRLDPTRTNGLDRSLRKAFPDGPPPNLATRPVRLAVLSSSTVSHLLPAIRVGGLWIETYEAPFGAYAQDLADPASNLHALSCHDAHPARFRHLQARSSGGRGMTNRICGKKCPFNRDRRPVAPNAGPVAKSSPRCHLAVDGSGWGPYTPVIGGGQRDFRVRAAAPVIFETGLDG